MNLFAGLQILKGVAGLVTGGGMGKGLVGSKTAQTGTVALVAKIGGIFVLPLPSWLQWVLVGTVLVEWLVQLYLRVITKEAI